MKTIIEETAIELAAAYYDVARQQGLTTIYKNQRKYVKAHWEKFISKAIEHLNEILKGDYPDAMKAPIYEAFILRANWVPQNGLRPFDPKWFQ